MAPPGLLIFREIHLCLNLYLPLVMQLTEVTGRFLSIKNEYDFCLEEKIITNLLFYVCAGHWAVLYVTTFLIKHSFPDDIQYFHYCFPILISIVRSLIDKLINLWLILFYIYVRIILLYLFKLYFDMIQYKICPVTSDSLKGRWSSEWVGREINFPGGFLNLLKVYQKIAQEGVINNVCRNFLFQTLFGTVFFLHYCFEFGNSMYTVHIHWQKQP